MIMRKIALMLLFFAGSVQAEFQIEKSIVCDDVKKIFAYFQKDPYNETPMWSGRDIIDPSVQHTLLVNHQTGTWTMIAFNAEIGCVLGAGTNPVLISNNLGNPT
jgi:hypothetical protein